MRHTDIVIAGGGLAGSTAAAMLARDGFGVVLVDPHPVYPPDLRCEKLDGPQVSVLRRTGLADAVLRAGTFDGECWIARFGRVIEKRAGDQYGILYDTLVNTIRAEISPRAEFINAKVNTVANSPDRQVVTLSTGEQISARLVVVANGLNIGLRHALGMTREDVSPCHSITIAFDLKPVGRSHFDFPALTYYPERASDRMAYITLFPIGVDDARELHGLSRHERSVAERDAAPSGRNAVRADAGPAQADRRSRSGRAGEDQARRSLRHARACAAGRRAGRRRLRHVVPGGRHRHQQGVHRRRAAVQRAHPAWLASEGMGVDKIGAFYADPVKAACDHHSFDKAFTPSLDVDRPRPGLARAPLGALPRPLRHRYRAPDHGAAAGAFAGARRCALPRARRASFPCTSDSASGETPLPA